MPRECAIIATIKRANQRWQRPALIPPSLTILMHATRSATWLNTTKRERGGNLRRPTPPNLPNRLKALDRFSLQKSLKRMTTCLNQFRLTRRKTKRLVTSFSLPRMNHRARLPKKKARNLQKDSAYENSLSMISTYCKEF